MFGRLREKREEEYQTQHPEERGLKENIKQELHAVNERINRLMLETQVLQRRTD